MISKEKIASALNHFPTEIDLEQFIDELILLEKIENGVQDLENSRSITDQELDAEIEKWQK
jgi:hypothetical protein